MMFLNGSTRGCEQPLAKLHILSSAIGALARLAPRLHFQADRVLEAGEGLCTNVSSRGISELSDDDLDKLARAFLELSEPLVP
jgi:hypothetical protein